MPLSTEKENYCKIAILTVDVLAFILRSLLDYYLSLHGFSLPLMLNNYKHKIFHLYRDKPCQKPPCPYKTERKILNSHQLSILFDTSVIKLPCCDFGIFTHCTAYGTLRTKDLDITLLRIVLTNCCLGLFWNECLNNYHTGTHMTFSNFLNNKKHDIYHLWRHDSQCCQCNQLYKSSTDHSVISKAQFKTLFSETSIPSCCSRKICIICASDAAKSILHTDIDDKLSIIVLDAFCPLKKIVNNLVEYRNDAYAHVKEASLSDSEFQDIWHKITTEMFKLSTFLKNEKVLQVEIDSVSNVTVNVDIYRRNIQLIENQLAQEVDIKDEIIKIVLDTRHSLQEQLSDISSTLDSIASSHKSENDTKEVTFVPQSESSKVCDPCSCQYICVHADVWCSECDESYCKPCGIRHSYYKQSKSHRLIAIEDYNQMLKSGFKNSNRKCTLHREHLAFFCPFHDEAVCVVCVQTKHAECPIPLSIDDVAEKSKLTAPKDLEQHFDELLRTLNTMRANVIRNYDLIDAQNHSIVGDMNSFKLEVTKELISSVNLMEKDTTSILTNKTIECTSYLETALLKINDTEKKIKKYHDQWKLMEKSGNVVENFFGIHELKQALAQEECTLDSLIESHREIQINFFPNNDIYCKLQTVKPTLGDINISTMSRIVVNNLSQRKIRQAQCQSLLKSKVQSITADIYKINSLPTVLNIHDVLNGTSMTEDLIVLAVQKNKQLIILNYEQSSHSCLETSSKPYDVACVDNNRVVVSYGYEQYVEFISIDKRTVTSKLKLDGNSWGVSCFENLIYVVVYKHGVNVLTDEAVKLRNIPINVDCVYFLSVNNDRILYTDWTNTSLNSSDFNGNPIWSFENADLKASHGVTCDRFGNAFVTGCDSNNVFVVSPDSNSWKILEVSKEIEKPSGIFYDKKRSRLFILTKKEKEFNVIVLNIK